MGLSTRFLDGVRLEAVREKMGCTEECNTALFEISDSSTVTLVHNGVTRSVDAAAAMEPGYDGPGWLTQLMEGWHDDARALG